LWQAQGPGRQLQGVSLQISTPPTAAAEPVTDTDVTTRNPQTGQVETKEVPIPTPVRAATPAAAAAPAGAAPKDSVFIDADDRTNRILIIGKPDQITLINELVDVLDVPQYNSNTFANILFRMSKRLRWSMCSMNSGWPL